MNLFQFSINPDKISQTDWWNLNAFFAQRISSESGRAWLFLGMAMLCIVIPYLLGSINPAILISKLVYRDDIRRHGSGNAGSTNMLRTYGTKAAVFTMLLDFLKAILATVIGTLLLGYNGMAIGGLFVGVGHMFPAYYKLKGGKGVACFAMVGLVMHPFVFLALLVTFLIVAIGTRFVSLASVTAAFMFPLYVRAFVPHNNLGGSHSLPPESSISFVNSPFQSRCTPSAVLQICTEYLPAKRGNALRYSRVTCSTMLFSSAGSIRAMQQPLKPAPEKRPP